MSTFDPTRRLVLGSFRTVLGHQLDAGTPLVIVDQPSAPGEVEEGLARMLWNKKVALYAEDARPTPVETPAQEQARLAREAMRDGEEVPVLTDLLVWQVDDAETGKKQGDRVTKDDLLVIAARERVPVEGDDNKPDLIRKITARRALGPDANSTNSETETMPTQGGAPVYAATGPVDSDHAPDAPESEG